jgi:hypothetical protein
MNGMLLRLWKETVLADFGALSWNSLGEAEENYEKPKSKRVVTRSKKQISPEFKITASLQHGIVRLDDIRDDL